MADSRRFAQLQGSGAGGVGLTDALWVESVASEERAAYERRIGAPISRLGEGGAAAPAPGYLAASYATGGSQGRVRQGADVSSVPALAAAIRDRRSVFAVAASRRAEFAGRGGFFLLQAAHFGRGPGSRGFLVVFVPRGWLAVGLQLDPREVSVRLDGAPLEGRVEGDVAASGSFETLARRWEIGVARPPVAGLRAVLPWFALAWPIAVALLGYLLLRGVMRRRRAEREVERIFELSVDLLCVANLDGYFTRVNPAFERTLGYSAAELVAGRSPTSCIPTTARRRWPPSGRSHAPRTSPTSRTATCGPTGPSAGSSGALAR